MEESNQINQIVNIKICRNPNCDNIIDSNKPKYSIYCSELCRTRHSAIRQYEKLRNNEEFKLKRKIKNKIYYENNKENLKFKMRIYGMEYYFKKRDEKKKEDAYKKEETHIQKEETKDEEKGESTINQTINI